MAQATLCQTPDAIYSIELKGDTVSVSVELPDELDLSPGEELLLEQNLHNAVELVLARFFPFD